MTIKSYEQRFHSAHPEFPLSVPTDRLLELLSELPEVYRDFIERGLIHKQEENDAGSI